MYKYLPYTFGRQPYVLESPCGIRMLSAQRWLFAPPFVVSFPCKVKKRKYVVPKNIHTLPSPRRARAILRVVGLQKEAISGGVRGCLQRFFPGGLSKIGELLINSSFSVEQAISYFTVTNVSKQVS